jgi:putative transposase
VERFPDHVRGFEEIREIPRGQRFLGGPKSEGLCGGGVAGDRGKRNELILAAVGEWGYRQKEVADCLGLHYSTVSRLVKEELSRSKTL